MRYLKKALYLLFMAIFVLLPVISCGKTPATSSTSVKTSVPSITTPPIWTPPLILHPITPPEGSVSLPGGIKVTPSVASPWPDLPVYEDVYTLAEIKTGGEFSIGLDTSFMLGASWTANCDESVLSLVTEEIAYYDTAQRLGTQWFRFKAITEHNNTTIITFDFVAPDNKVVMRLTFGINVIK